MKIDISFPVKSIRHTDGAASYFNGGGSFSFGVVDVIKSEITIKELTSPSDNAIISLRYEEDYNPSEALKHFFNRAREHGEKYINELIKDAAVKNSHDKHGYGVFSINDCEVFIKQKVVSEPLLSQSFALRPSFHRQ